MANINETSAASAVDREGMKYLVGHLGLILLLFGFVWADGGFQPHHWQPMLVWLVMLAVLIVGDAMESVWVTNTIKLSAAFITWLLVLAIMGVFEAVVLGLIGKAVVGVFLASHGRTRKRIDSERYYAELAKASHEGRRPPEYPESLDQRCYGWDSLFIETSSTVVPLIGAAYLIELITGSPPPVDLNGEGVYPAVAIAGFGLIFGHYFMFKLLQLIRDGSNVLDSLTSEAKANAAAVVSVLTFALPALAIYQRSTLLAFTLFVAGVLTLVSAVRFAIAKRQRARAACS